MDVQAVIAQPPHATYASPDSPVRRDAWQVLDLPWVAAKDPADAVVTRLIITRRPAIEPGKPRVGKRVGDHVFELFVTDRCASGWSIEDVLSIYFARGGFEATLAQEDRERDLDRTVSWIAASQAPLERMRRCSATDEMSMSVAAAAIAQVILSETPRAT